MTPAMGTPTSTLSLNQWSSGQTRRYIIIAIVIEYVEHIIVVNTNYKSE